MSILKKKLEFAVGCVCLYLVYLFAIQIISPKQAEEIRQPITTINVTQHIDAYENQNKDFNYAKMEEKAGVQAQKMVRTGDIKEYEAALKKSGMLGW